MEQWDHTERRQYTRIEKHFIISYYLKSDPAERHDISQVKNISMGGMCFVAGQNYEEDAKIGIELKTPYLNETAHIEGNILQSHEKVPNMIYEIRLKYDELSTTAKLVLNKIIETFLALQKEQSAEQSEEEKSDE